MIYKKSGPSPRRPRALGLVQNALIVDQGQQVTGPQHLWRSLTRPPGGEPRDGKQRGKTSWFR